AWLGTPVEHARDVRSGLMVKLALLDRRAVDSRDLLQAQLARLLPVAAALDDRLRASTGFEHTLVLWRHEAMTATMRFLESLTARREVGSGLLGLPGVVSRGRGRHRQVLRRNLMGHFRDTLRHRARRAQRHVRLT
ncbi:MAG: hypothetical protein ACREOE_09245, partial [Gemmatimonadales bacterium]